MEPKIPTLCWEKALGPPQHCARPPHTPFWGTPRDQSGQGSLHRGFIPNLAVPIPTFSPRTLTPVLPALCALAAAPRSLRGDKATISRPPTTTAHTRVQGLEGPQGATAMGVQGLGHGEPTQQRPILVPPLLWARPVPPRAPMGAGPGRQHPALVPPALPCCSVRCRPAVTGDVLVCTTGFIEHGEAGGRGRVRTESCSQQRSTFGCQRGDFHPWVWGGSVTHRGDAGGGCHINAAGDQRPETSPRHLWEASWHAVHATGFCEAAQPGLGIASLLLLPLGMGLAVVSVVVVSMASSPVVPAGLWGSLIAARMVVRVEGLVLVVDGGL